jgi:hypothetical protein
MSSRPGSPHREILSQSEGGREVGRKGGRKEGREGGKNACSFGVLVSLRVFGQINM